MLMTPISGGDMVQTIHSIRVSDVKILGNKVIIPIMSVIKQNKPTKTHDTHVFPDIQKRAKALCCKSPN